MKLCLVVLLVIILLYCCLGTINISEGLTNSSNSKHHSGSSNSKHHSGSGKSQHMLGPGGTQHMLGQVELVNIKSLSRSGYDPAREVYEGKKYAKKEGREYQREISGECPYGLNKYGYCKCPYGKDKYGYCLEPNAKNKNSNPGKYNDRKSCDNAGFIWNNSLKKCEEGFGPGGTQHMLGPGGTQHMLGPGGTYQYGTRSGCENAGYMWNESSNTCETNFPGKGGSGTLNQCPEGTEWDHKKKMCVHSKKDKCPSGMHWSKSKQKCVHTKQDDCPDGMHWNNKKSKCVKDRSDSDSDSDWESDIENDASNDWDKFKSNINKFFNQNQHSPMNQNAGTYPAHAVKRRHEIPPGDENLYILKSEIVPPVCPACPPVIEGGGCPAACKAKCAPCPRPPPIPPCPPCERCPEPQFQCKKVPDYKNIIPGNLPRPLLNDFSQFT